MVDDVPARRRSVEIRVKLSPVLAEELSSIASSRGLLPATLAAVALGEYVEKCRQNAHLTKMIAIDMSKRMAASVMDPEVLGKAVADAISNPELLKVLMESEATA
jgi:hypothetical protein